MYRELDSRLIESTADLLVRRIAAQFPGSGLSRVGAELCTVAHETAARLAQLRRPNWPLRLLVWSGVVVLALGALVAPFSIRIDAGVGGLSDVLQGIEAAINNVVFIVVGLFFLATVENRPRRRAALGALHELRSIAHIIDMHQLRKDPEHIEDGRFDVGAGSPVGRLELAHYLDFCSELLSIASKLAALYAQHLNDPVVLAGVNDVQTLADGLSSKIWQKIMILDIVAAREGTASG